MGAAMANLVAMGSGSVRGRRTECALLDGVVSAIRAGESRTLVLHGEAGIGKTALLNYLLESAAGMRLFRAAGVESEMELAFASLHPLCAPLLEAVERLPRLFLLVAAAQETATRRACASSIGGGVQ
jgi:uncharacterized cupredoxin-like copper-binding protein